MALRMNRRPTVLLTGFGPFRNVRRNASAALVKSLAREARLALPHCRFTVAVLPTEWVRAPSLLSELYERHAPALAGLDRHRRDGADRAGDAVYVMTESGCYR